MYILERPDVDNKLTHDPTDRLDLFVVDLFAFTSFVHGLDVVLDDRCNLVEDIFSVRCNFHRACFLLLRDPCPRSACKHIGEPYQVPPCTFIWRPSTLHQSTLEG